MSKSANSALLASNPPEYWHQACAYLSERDAVMADLIRRYPASVLRSRGAPFYTLVRSVVGQQISVKAADSIWTRFLAVCPLVTPEQVLACSPDTLRSVGLSARKVAYIVEIALYFSSPQSPAHHAVVGWEDLSDAQVIEALTTIRGIGVWTAQMFLIFTLLRPNVLPTDDIGLLRGLEKAYFCDKLTPKAAFKLYFERFSPYCTVATWFLWRSLDPVEVHY